MGGLGPRFCLLIQAFPGNDISLLGGGSDGVVVVPSAHLEAASVSTHDRSMRHHKTEKAYLGLELLTLKVAAVFLVPLALSLDAVSY